MNDISLYEKIPVNEFPIRLLKFSNQQLYVSPHWHEHTEMLYFFSGTGKVACGGKIFDVKKGDFVFLDPPYGGTKSRYTQTPFDLDDFYNTLDMLNSKGVNWMLTFDGSSGERNYEYAPPEELYKSSFKVNTGKSAFRKVIDKIEEDILESVYLNYQSTLF